MNINNLNQKAVVI